MQCGDRVHQVLPPSLAASNGTKCFSPWLRSISLLSKVPKLGKVAGVVKSAVHGNFCYRNNPNKSSCEIRHSFSISGIVYTVKRHQKVRMRMRMRMNEFASGEDFSKMGRILTFNP